jgi:hypothetical protein
MATLTRYARRRFVSSVSSGRSCSCDACVAVGEADIEPRHSMLRIDATQASQLQDD